MQFVVSYKKECKTYALYIYTDAETVSDGDILWKFSSDGPNVFIEVTNNTSSYREWVLVVLV